MIKSPLFSTSDVSRIVIAIIILLLQTNFIVAQAPYKQDDIPQINVADFQGVIPDNATFPIYINTRIYYNIDTAHQVGVKKYKVEVSTWVELRHDESYWDKNNVGQEAEPQMVNHEQGHFYLAHITANKIKKALVERTYSEKYQDEVDEQFQIELRRGSAVNARYEQETVHGRNFQYQKKWDKWIYKELQ